MRLLHPVRPGTESQVVALRRDEPDDSADGGLHRPGRASLVHRMSHDQPSPRSGRAGARARRDAERSRSSAVLGPGLLAGLSDDDPAGITTYSVLGAEYGYQLLWVLLLSTAALILFHDLGSRLGVISGQGLIGLVRHRYGVRVAAPCP